MSTNQAISPAKVLRDPRLYLHYWLATNNMTVNERGELKDSLGRHTHSIFNTIYLDYNEQCRAYHAVEATKAPAQRQNVRSFHEKDLSKALAELIDREIASYRVKRASEIKCKKEDLQPVKTFVRAVTGKEDEKDIAVVAHWIWLVKRKFLDMPCSYHIMPVVVGKQGSGKTVAINKLLTPMQNWRLNIKMNQMADERYHLSMSTNFVVMFDELQGASRTDVDVLKNQITTDTNDTRILGTQQVVKVKQNCSFLGASNKNVVEQILDTTGARRFWQIDSLDKVDWATVNAIDYESMWVGVDEKKADGYIIEHIVAITEAQEAITAKDELDIFLEAHETKRPIKGFEKNVSVDTFYQAYQGWCSTNGIMKPLNSVWFGRKLAGKGIASVTQNKGGSTKRYYQVNPECALVKQSTNVGTVVNLSNHRL